MNFLFLLVFIPLVSLRLHTDDLRELEELLQPEHKSHIKSSYFDYLLGNNDDVDDDDVEISPFRFPSRKIYENDDDFVPPIEFNRDDETTTMKIRPKTEDASKCVDQYEIKSEQIVRVKYLKDNAKLMRMISIEQPSASSQFSLKEICIMKCCAENDCDLAMLSEQHTRDGYKCYLFSCNGTCPLATHQDYSVMIPKKIAQIYTESLQISSTSTSKTNVAENQNRRNENKSIFRRISILSILLVLSLTSTLGLIIFLVCYCRHHRKRGRRLKNYSVDADYLINGLYL